MQSSLPLVNAMYVHVLWTFLLYGALTIARAPAVWKVGLPPDGRNPFAEIEKRISANLRNQFEWPLFLYAVCLLLIAKPELATPMHETLAWVFIVGRVVHSLIQVMTSNIRLRGIVFTVNFLAVFAMWTLVMVER